MNDPLATAKFFLFLNENYKAKQVLDLLKPYAKSISDIDELGSLYSKNKNFEDVLELAHKVYNLCETEDQKYNARQNIIRGYLNLNKPLEALKHIQINEKINPKDYCIQLDKAFVNYVLNKKDDGEKILRDLLNEPIDDDLRDKVLFNLGSHDLRKGNFKEGLKASLIGGKKHTSWKKHRFPLSQLWEGQPSEGKTILLCAEGGIGDEIISIRFMKHLKERGMNPIWYSDRKDLVEVFRRCGFNCMTNVTNLPADWLWTYSMLVPAYLGVTEEELWYGPYITPIKEAPELQGNKKIGIKCGGNPYYEQDLHRTLPLDELLDCIPEDYTIYSFHVEEEINHPRVIQLKDKLKSWDNTIDYLSQMDMVVSSCTSLIHASGALGKKSAVVVPILNYYVWAKPERTSKWYSDDLVIFRQDEHDNWRKPLRELKEYLHNNS